MSEKDKVSELISTATEIAGASVGGALGFLAGDPSLAALASGLGVGIAKGSKNILLDIANRTLSKREEMRIGTMAAYSLDKVRIYIEEGKQPRNDGFFNEREDNRSNADEIFEGILLKAKNEHEEKKMKILANIFANISFMSELSVGEANHLIQIASNLTYRKMCILALLERKDNISDIHLRDQAYSEGGINVHRDFDTMCIAEEIFEMANLGLIICRDDDTEIEKLFMRAWIDVAPNKLSLTRLGKRYYDVMGIDDISKDDIREIARYLS